MDSEPPEQKGKPDPSLKSPGDVLLERRKLKKEQALLREQLDEDGMSASQIRKTTTKLMKAISDEIQTHLDGSGHEQQ